MKTRTVVILIIAGIILLGIAVWPSGKYSIKEVLDGNTFVLDNGATVKLIGVTSTMQGKDELLAIMGEDVELVPDKTAQFDPREVDGNVMVYAYVLIIDNGYECINATLLKNGSADILEEAFLQDSLDAFRHYADKGRGNREVDPTPTPKPPIIYEEDSIILPEPPSPEKRLKRKHQTWYPDGSMNLEMLEEACDYNCPYTKQFANSLAAKSPGNFNPGQICAIFDYCYNKWRYVNDPQDHEYVATASETIEGSLVGDCDDFAILMASCILAVGGRACINTGWTQTSGHAFTEVDIAQFGESTVLSEIRKRFPQYGVNSLATRRDGNHLWMNLDWQAAYPGGKYWQCSKRESYPYENGEWTWVTLR